MNEDTRKQDKYLLGYAVISANGFAHKITDNVPKVKCYGHVPLITKLISLYDMNNFHTTDINNLILNYIFTFQ